MSTNSFKVKNSLVLTPVDLVTLTSPEAGDVACDIVDNKIKKYDSLTSTWTEIGATVDTSIIAPINSPTFTGSPRAPTPTAGDDSTKIATTEFVNDRLNSFVDNDSFIRLSGGNGFGTTNTTTRRFLSALKSIGTAITYQDSATAGGRFIANVEGIYSVSYSEESNTGNLQSSVFIYVNDTPVQANQSDYNGSNIKRNGVSWTGHLEVGDVVTARVASAAENSGMSVWFSMARQSKTGFGTSSNVSQNRNLLINGNFHYSQRKPLADVNYEYSGYGDYIFFADRWYFGAGGEFNYFNIRRSLDSGSNGSAYSLRHDVTNVNGSIGGDSYHYGIYQAIEGSFFKRAAGKNLVLSFLVKSSKVGTYSINLTNEGATRVLVKEFQVNVANTWEKKVVRFTHDTSGSWLHNTGVGLRVGFILSTDQSKIAPDVWTDKPSGNLFYHIGIASTNQVLFGTAVGDNFSLSEVCLVEDNESRTLTPEFTLASNNLAEELNLCRRYYEKSYDLGAAEGSITSSGVIKDKVPLNVVGGFASTYQFRAEKRVTPVVNYWNPASSFVTGFRSSDGTNIGVLSFTREATPNNFSLQNSVAIGTPVISFHYVAEAELI